MLLSDLGASLQVVVDLMDLPFDIFGVTLSFWEIGLYLLIGGIIIKLIVRFLQ